ncbi:MAG TPA: hypothetical protein VLR52_00910, partial [Bacteroidales bacterium]|nr:hypothetical protein [Bacteroidales bacterium]
LKALLFLPLIALMVQVFAQVSTPAAPVVSGVAPSKYLVLNPEQLKLLGFEFNSEGLFYKNVRPNQVEYQCLDMIFMEKVYSSSIVVRKGEKTGHFPGEKVIKKMKETTFDFFPVVVSDLEEHQTLVTAPLRKYEKEKLLPVQVNMADLEINGRSDTLIFWFLPTESLKQVLSTIQIDDYLQICPPDNRNPPVKPKKMK